MKKIICYIILIFTCVFNTSYAIVYVYSDPKPFDFGNVNICDCKTMTLRIINPSSENFYGIISSGQCGPFFSTCILAGCSTTVAHNTGQNVASIKFCPTESGGASCSYAITNHPDCYFNDVPYSSSTTIYVSVQGMGVVPGSLSLNISPTSIDFGSKICGEWSEQTVTISKPTSIKCEIDGILYSDELDPPFNFAGYNTNFTLTDQNPNFTFTVRYKPLCPGTYSDNMRIVYSAPSAGPYTYNYSVQGSSAYETYSDDWNYLFAAENMRKIYLFKYLPGSSFSYKYKINPINCNDTLKKPSGAVVINSVLYIADQGDATSGSGNIYKYYFDSLKGSVFTISGTEISHPIDIQYRNGKIYILTQTVSGNGVNSIIIYDLNGIDTTKQVILPQTNLSHDAGSPTRLTFHNDSLFLAMIGSGTSYFCSFYEGDLQGNTLPSNKFIEKKSYSGYIAISKGYVNEILISHFQDGNNYCTLEIYSNGNYTSQVITGVGLSPYIMQSPEIGEEDILFLASTSNDKIYKIQKSTGSVLSELYTASGVYLINPKGGNYNISLAVEGFYDGTNMSMTDTFTVYLARSVSPYDFLDSAKSTINKNTLNGIFRFNRAASENYYIVIKHRNSIQTWSRNGSEIFRAGEINNYDFTDSQTKAYGSNMNLKLGKWCIINGDCNQDGYIDGSDYLEVSNYYDMEGYYPGDNNGDGYIDGSDYIQISNNYDVGIITPP